MTQSNSIAQRASQRLFDVGGRISKAIAASRDHLFSRQEPEGWWCGELEADTTLVSDYVFMHTLLNSRDEERMTKCARQIRNCQNADGGWPIYEGGPSNVSASVKAYFALKMTGSAPDEEYMQRARKRILELGGVPACNTFAKIYLCALGQYEYDAVPAIPPEIVLFPRWFWFNLYEISSWSRGILVPLAICYARKPFRKIPREWGVEELYPKGKTMHQMRLQWDKKLICWRNFFLVLDRLCHFFERVHIRPLRKLALKRAERWMLDRMEKSDGLAAIYPAILNSIIAMRCLGYSEDDPQVMRAIDEFEKLGVEEADTFRMQPCMSPVWDTAYAITALGESGVDPRDERMTRACEWMLDKQVRDKGDWAVKVRNVEPAGWYFEHNNEFYPDTDDSAQVMIALSHVETANGRYQQESIDRAIRWELAMQCKNGGWASFDRDNDKMVFQYVPFADHNAMLDPATVDITGRILESFSLNGFTLRDKPVARAIDFIRREQEPDGSWFGRWGVNYIYGTMCVLRGLEAIGFDMSTPMPRRAAEWLLAHQNADGGWGETIATYDDDSLRGSGLSTASQTAWALIALMCCGLAQSEAVARGVEWLLATQLDDGSWFEKPYTGTGFPKVFYLKYTLYYQYFPLMALSKFRGLTETGR